jgi:alkylation response protein AidB-like acyl-CoA dehydrogenase
VRFAFTDEQLELRAALSQVLERECTTADLRAVAESDGIDTAAGRGEQRWAVLGDMGANALLVPEDAGGLGLSQIELVGVLEEAGRVALPEPLAETACLAAPLTGRADRAGMGGVDVAATGPVPSSTVGEDGRTHTPRAAGAVGAEQLVLCARSPTGGWEVHEVAPELAEVRHSATLDQTRPLGSVSWSPSPSTLLLEGDDASNAVSELADRGAFASGAQLLGLTDRMITMSAEYVTARHQFGVPVGSFQAVKHHLANARVRLEFARPAVYRAAWSLATADPDRSEHCSMAKALASDAADLAARVALQVHGAIGYTWECDLHFFMKRAWALSAEWGSARVQRSRVLAAALARAGATP